MTPRLSLVDECAPDVNSGKSALLTGNHLGRRDRRSLLGQTTRRCIHWPKEFNNRMLKRWLVRSRVMVAFAFSGARPWNCFEKAGNLLVGGICPPVKDQHRYSDSLESVGTQNLHKCATNDRRHHFRISSCNPSGS